MFCPKCNQFNFDNAQVCFKCGYVLNYEQPDSRDLYDMILKKINSVHNFYLARHTLKAEYDISEDESNTLLNTIGNTVLRGCYKGNILYLKDQFLRFGYEMDFIPSNNEYISPANSVIEKKLSEKDRKLQIFTITGNALAALLQI